MGSFPSGHVLHALASAALSLALTACGSANSGGLFGPGGADGRGQGGVDSAGSRGDSPAASGGTSTGLAPSVAPSATFTPPATADAAPPPRLPADAGADAARAEPLDASGVPPEVLALAECDTTGTWATFIRVPVSWPAAPLVLLAGTGEIFQWNLSKRVQVAPLETEEDTVPCGIFLPDLQADVLQTFQRYGIRFPDALFDEGAIPSVRFSSRATLGAELTFESDVIATLIGVGMPFATTATWPPVTYTPDDHDLDQKLGVTVLPVEADGYNYPPVGLPPVPLVDLPRARRIYLMTRSVAKLSGKITSCDELQGSVEIQVLGGTPGINSTVIGCQKLDGTECVQSEWEFVNDNRPQFEPTGLGTLTSVRLGDDATCADVRARFPMPG